MYDALKIKTLGKFFMKLEVRGKEGSYKKLFRVLFSFLLPGILIPFLLFKQNTDPSGFAFAFFSYVLFSLLVAFSIVSELDNLLISKTEAEILTTFPVDDRLVVNAKMYVIWRYVLITSIPILLPGSFFFYFIVHSFARAALYIISGFIMFLFFTYILLLLYSFTVRVFKTASLNTYTLIFQVLLIFLFIIGYQFISYTFTGKVNFRADSYMEMNMNSNIINFIPSSWFAFIVARHNYIPDFQFIIKVFLPFVIVLLSFLSLKFYLLENFSSIRNKFLLSRIFYNKKEGTHETSFLSNFSNKLLSLIYIRNNYESSSFTFLRKFYRRDKMVRLNIFPIFVIPAGLAIFAFITNQLPSPFYFNSFSPMLIFHISILFSILVVLNTGILGIKLSNYAGASWIYRSFPMASKKRFKNGIRKFFVIYILIPLNIILFALFVFKMPVIDAVLHSLFLFLCANMYNSITHLFSKALPFTKENTFLNSMQRITSLLIPISFGIIFILIQVYAYREILYLIISLVSILIVTFFINYLGFRRE